MPRDPSIFSIHSRPIHNDMKKPSKDVEIDSVSEATTKQESNPPQPSSEIDDAVLNDAEAAAETQGCPNDKIMQQLEQVQAECEDYQDRYLRAVADLDNFRKRALREKEEIRRLANAALIEDLLPIMDHFALGLAAAQKQPEAKNISDGFVLVANQLTEVLRQNGVEAIDPVGDPFDPNCHECVAHEPSDTVPEEHVIAVSRKGYWLNQRLLRPAQVLVSRGAATQDAPPPDDTVSSALADPSPQQSQGYDETDTSRDEAVPPTVKE